MLVPGGELGGSSLFSLLIGSVSFRTAGSDPVTFERFDVHAGTASGAVLSGRFDDNYRDEPTLLYSASDVTFSPSDGWVTIHLDREYLFNGTDSMVMEISYSGASASALYSGYQETDGCMTVYTGDQDATTGNPERFAPHMTLTGMVYFGSIFGKNGF